MNTNVRQLTLVQHWTNVKDVGRQVKCIQMLRVLVLAGYGLATGPELPVIQLGLILTMTIGVPYSRLIN